MYELSYPWVFVFLPLPWLAALCLPHATPETALKLPEGVELPGLAEDTAPRKVAPHPLALLIWILLLLALAGPRWLGNAQPYMQQGRDLMLAVDLSGSMDQRGLNPSDPRASRLDTLKEVMTPFIQRRAGDRLGLILFGSNAYLQAPLSFDHTTIAQLLNESMINLAGQKTALGDAIGLAIKTLEPHPERNRVLILITDGQNTAGNIAPEQAAAVAQAAHIKIYTIGIGQRSQQRGIWRINPSADLDEASLKKIAQLTGGQYFRADSEQSLERIYQVLDQLEPALSQNAFFRPEKALFHWPLGIALGLSFLWVAFSIKPNTGRPALANGSAKGGGGHD